MKHSPIAQSVSDHGVTIVLRTFADGRTGFDYMADGKRRKIRACTLDSAIQKAQQRCRYEADKFLRERPLPKGGIEIFSDPLPTEIPEQKHFVMRRIGRLAKACRKRASGRGMQCSITAEDIFRMAEEQHWRCAVTTLPFNWSREAHWTKAPFAPSIDRIDNREGYVSGNVRLVINAVNVAMNEWGMGVFTAVCRAFMARA